ncbi:MAG: glycoside hydrolase family 38 C-terminal domain-containing protein [Candidatus Aminicenantes bacterium]|jgi:alpha-mannosidase
MRQKNITNPFILFIVLFLFLFDLPSLSAVKSSPDAVSDLIKQIEDQVNTAVRSWQFSIQGKDWKNQHMHASITQDNFRLKTSIRGTEVFSGVKVKGTPLYLKLRLHARGLCEVNVTINNRDVESFTVDGSSGTGKDMEQEVLVTHSTDLRDYHVVLIVKNKGFKPFRTQYWPPRKNPLKEEDISFRITGADILFPRAANRCREVNHWLLAMKTAQRLLNPDFHRFTFTGKPYRIQDNRKTPKERLIHLNNLLQQAVSTFDQAALKQGQSKTLAASIQKSYQIAAPLQEYAKAFKVYLIGNAHIDIAWLWRIAETVVVARNTYDTVIKNIKEYPELHYAQSQALTYEWIEQRYPELFEKIKQQFQKGNWEIVGGMWVEPDCNLISGESWVRQLLYGKNYFKEKFGIDVNIGWNVDSFGYNWNMPQIYKKSGIDVFVTQKIWWNDTTVFPYYIFWWEGVDGTRLLSYFPPVGYTSRVQPDRVSNNITKYEASTGYKKSLILYGIGDHGGGPNKEILNRVRDYNKLYIAPEFIHSKSGDFLSNITNDLGNDIPVWKDELYLEYHRGTYTTQAKIKKGNRKCESLISTAEKLASLASIMGGPYPQQELEHAWKLILTNQFHDILPGSHITPVARDALESYEKAGKKIKKIGHHAIDYIIKKINTSKVKAGIPLLVFNPLSWERTDWVVVEYPRSRPAGDTLKILDSQGKEIPAEIEKDKVPQRLTIAFIARDIPPLGYRVYSMVNIIGETKNTTDDSQLKAKGETLENRFYKIVFNRETGNIKSIYSKLLEKEFVREGKEANVLQVYEDRPENWDAWNIGYTGRMWELNRADSVEIVKISPVRVVMRVKKSFLGLEKARYSPTEDFPSSFFTQDITLYRDLDRIDIKTEADWWESHMFLKAAFPLSITNDYACYEIPFAAIRRTTKFETLWEKARFEVPALRWADLSEKQYGFSLLNDCKYGYDIHGDVMKISLLRSPTWPDPMADRGKHQFTYSIYVHRGRWDEADTVKKAHQLNSPLVARVTDRHQGKFPGVFSFFSVNSSGVILDTIKKAEKDKAFIFRLYESIGKAEKAELNFFKAPKKIIETDLMENDLREIQFTGNKVSLDFKKFEIKTLKVLWN